jgi:hypothetical protein
VKRTARMTLAVCAVAAAVILWATGLLLVRLKPYWVAKYRGEGANLERVMLIYAPLARASLHRAVLRDADLSHADLRGADLCRASLYGANLIGADLRGTLVLGADLSNARLPGVKFKGAIGDPSTRWPAGFRPEKHGVARQAGCFE